MKINLIPRNSTAIVCNKSFIVDKEPNRFFENLNLEVRQSPKKTKRLLQMLSITYTALILPLVTSDIVLAAPTSNPIPEELTSSLLTVIGVIAAIGVSIAIITLMLAGAWKMLFGRNRADAWTTDILKGLAQIIISPILVALIVGIATLLFSNVPAFQPIKSPIEVFFHH